MTRTRKTLRLALVMSLVTAPLALTFAGPANAAPGASRTYTLNADFDEGVANNVVHSTPDQLQLDDTVTAFPFIWVALSARGTIAKIDTATGTVLGEYSTTSDGDNGHNPSRTTVGNDGSVWAGNRNQSSVIHVGVAEGGQCVDRNGNGTIETSTGYNNVLAWPGGSFGASSPVSNAADECILHYVDTPGGDARHVSVDGAGDIWVGNYNGSPHTFQKIDDVTGTILTTRTLPCGGYGGLIDGNGVLWSAQAVSVLLRWDPSLPDSATNPRCLNVPVYGLAFDSNNNIWGSTLHNGVVHKISPDGNTVQTFPTGNANAQGLAVDGNDDVWISNSLFHGANRIVHLKNNGTLVGHVTGMGGGSTGVAVDAAGKIWTANLNTSNATRIDPNGGAIGGDGVTRIGAFDLAVPLPGANPYNYSDMTGSTLTGKPKSGTWSVVYDSGIAGAEWGTVTWNGLTPGNSSLTFTAASSTDGITFGPGQTVTDGTDLTVGNGRYLKVTATFTRATDGAEESPVLYDVTISTADLNDPPAAEAGGPYDGDEGSPISVDGTASDVDGDALTYAWSHTATSPEDAGTTCSFGDATALDTTFECNDDGTYLLTLTVNDGSATTTDTATVVVRNVNPTINITAPATGALVPLGTAVNVASTFGDAGSNDIPTMACNVNWGDGTSAVVPPAVTSCGASNTFAVPGVYNITMKADDQDGGSATDSIMVIVYDPAGGFVTGGGWISSPAGAYRADPTLTGKANFGFVSKYKKGATVPEGQTQFQFHAGGFNFHSTAYEWLVVSGPKAQYKGSGTVNGAGGYGFILTANDGQVAGGGGVDRVRLKVVDKVSGNLVYDNQVGESDEFAAASQAIASGSIVIHKK